MSFTDWTGRSKASNRKPTLPADAAAKEASLLALLERADNFIAGTPQSVQAELSQLFALLPTIAGRRGIVRFASPWESATVGELSLAWYRMRASGTL